MTADVSLSQRPVLFAKTTHDCRHDVVYQSEFSSFCCRLQSDEGRHSGCLCQSLASVWVPAYCRRVLQSHCVVEPMTALVGQSTTICRCGASAGALQAPRRRSPETTTLRHHLHVCVCVYVCETAQKQLQYHVLELLAYSLSNKCAKTDSCCSTYRQRHGHMLLWNTV